MSVPNWIAVGFAIAVFCSSDSAQSHTKASSALLEAEAALFAWAKEALPGDRGAGLNREFTIGSYQSLPLNSLLIGLDRMEAVWIKDLAGTYLRVAFEPCSDEETLFDIYLEDGDEIEYARHCRNVIADFDALYGPHHPVVREVMLTYAFSLDSDLHEHRKTEAAYYEATNLRRLLDAADDTLYRGGQVDLVNALVDVYYNHSSLKSLNSPFGADLIDHPLLRAFETSNVRDARYLELIRDGIMQLEAMDFTPNMQFQSKVEQLDFLHKLKGKLVELLGATGNQEEARKLALPLIAAWEERLGLEATRLERRALHDLLADVDSFMEALDAAGMRDKAVQIGRRAVVLARSGDLPRTEYLLLNQLSLDLNAGSALVGSDGATVSSRMKLYPFEVTIGMEPDVPFDPSGGFEYEGVPTKLDCKADLQAALKSRPADAKNLTSLLKFWDGVEYEVAYGSPGEWEVTEYLHEALKSLSPTIRSCKLRVSELLARLYVGGGRQTEAEELYREVREAYRNDPGVSSYEFYRVTSEYSTLLFSQGRLEAGAALAVEATTLDGSADFTNIDGFIERSNAPAAAATAMMRYDRKDRALELAQWAFELARDQRGYAASATIGQFDRYAYILNASNKTEEAIGAYRLIEAFGTDTTDTFTSVADIFIRNGRFDIAERYARYLFDRTNAALSDPDSENTKENRLIQFQIASVKLALVLVEQAHFDEALELIGAAQKGLLDLLGYKDTDQRRVLLATLRALIGRGDLRSAVDLSRLQLKIETEVIEGLSTAEARLKILPNLHSYAARALRNFALEGGGSEAENQPLALREEAFLILQSGRSSPASEAVARNIARASLADEKLAPLFRDWSEALRTRAALQTELLASIDQNSSLTAGMLERSSKLDQQIAEAQSRLASAAPLLFEQSAPRPVSLTDLASPKTGLLKPNEALVFLSPGVKEAHGLVFVASHNGITWTDLPLSRKELETEIAAMHTTARVGLRALIPEKEQDSKADYDLVRAHGLYSALFQDAEVAALLEKASEWLVVAEGPFLSLPLNALPIALIAEQGARSTRWLGTEKALTVLTDAASLRRRVNPPLRNQANERTFIAFADPVLVGSLETNTTLAAARYTRDGVALRGSLEELPPLPGTRREAEFMAVQYGLEKSSLFLSENATETELFRLSVAGELERAEVVLIATHGLIAGAAEGVTEPALVLTPPRGGAEIIPMELLGNGPPLPGQPIDDGLLTASEAALLRIDADWVILSACDTASGDIPGAEGLSGLASGFLTAGAKSLLVSHWPVNDVAAERLTTFAFSTLRANPDIGRSEAMRLSMIEFIASAKTNEVLMHPAYWAPFQVIGLD